MSTLRVLLTQAPEAGRVDAWALFDAEERRVRSGRGTPDAWPEALRREAVLAASCMRIIELRLPPLPPDRVTAAATFALEDQLAGPAEEQHIAVSAQQPDGRVEATVVERALVAALAGTFDRIVAEPALAPRPPADRWRWHASQAGGGFVRKPDGATFATADADGIPAELALAVAHAARAGNGPRVVEIAFAPGAQLRKEAAAQAEVPFVPVAAWRWDEAVPGAISAATDLRQGEFSGRATAPGRGAARLFRWAAVLAALAIGVHVTATLGDWLALRIDGWRVKSALAAVASDAGVVGGDDPAAAIARRHADARHRAGLAAPADALPLLTRAAPALAALPPGMLRAATFADGSWTFDLSRADAATIAQLERQLAGAGLATLQAVNASGARVRASLAPGTP